MNWLSSLTSRWRAHIGLALLATVLCAAAIVFVTAADSSAAETKPAQTTKKKAAKKERDGAELYRVYCSRCHAERYPREKTDAQWKTAILHMRTRAQIPAKDAKAILKYLQENN